MLANVLSATKKRVFFELWDFIPVLTFLYTGVKKNIQKQGPGIKDRSYNSMKFHNGQHIQQHGYSFLLKTLTGKV